MDGLDNHEGKKGIEEEEEEEEEANFPALILLVTPLHALVCLPSSSSSSLPSYFVCMYLVVQRCMCTYVHIGLGLRT